MAGAFERLRERLLATTQVLETGVRTKKTKQELDADSLVQLMFKDDNGEEAFAEATFRATTRTFRRLRREVRGLGESVARLEAALDAKTKEANRDGLG